MVFISKNRVSINRGPYKQSRGFNLIELMVAVSVAGVLLGVGVPAMQDVMQNQEAKTAATDIHMSLLLARSEAIKRNTNIELERNSNWNNGWDVEVVSDSTLLKRQDPLTGLTVTCSTDSDAAAETCPATVTFTRAGRVSSFIEFRVSVDDNSKVTTRCVSMSLSGVPRVSIDDDQDSSNGCG